MENNDQILEELLKEGEWRAKPKHCYNTICSGNISDYCRFGHNHARICRDRVDEEKLRESCPNCGSNENVRVESKEESHVYGVPHTFQVSTPAHWKIKGKILNYKCEICGIKW